ncbi:heparan-alpha-glucosaminide N-acetyltransferase domain-containing protein [Rossellomorea aquimaris]|uniref:heparan-alpha-glucosaminide N-acetyltransferase domain-containing protein n=1 Tax=Rossellomorea aquimaris TaxID=189382 RepID=UPI001CD45C3D|nr:heparan-alpha-glucosaminide N-acetyltransferase domain-containing protein [Rossellomorea aquimaris]MCA1060816.1 heparan-alpha-glucosaminide N-acetyltransferase domain-containing protein [Rossellomorea aquimaris]
MLIKKNRVYSLDILRGIIVVLSVYLSMIPYGEYEFAYSRHAEWYGLTLVDIILPSFITIFGASMAIAYQHGVKWGKILKRTVRLILYGLIFTIIVSWSLDLSILRFTGVLQMFGILGLVTYMITRKIQSPLILILIALGISTVYGSGLLIWGQGCENQLPQPSCNLSGIVDGKVFGENHIYHQGERGFDPEGLMSSFSALSNVLLGYAFGRLLLTRKETGAWKELIGISLVLFALSFLWNQYLPFNKRIWDPAFSLLIAGIISSTLSLLYLIFDKREIDAKETALKPIVFYFEAFGRNSFLVYFGKYILSSILLHVTFRIRNEELTLYRSLVNWVDTFTAYPQITYALLMVGLWTAVALILHKMRWYLKV